MCCSPWGHRVGHNWGTEQQCKPRAQQRLDRGNCESKATSGFQDSDHVWIFHIRGESKGLGKIIPSSGQVNYADLLSLDDMWSGAK